jgi:predicted nucleic acid-binding protein
VIVVSNTSPLINLAAIGQFDRLRQMYQHAPVLNPTTRTCQSLIPKPYFSVYVHGTEYAKENK